LLSVKKANTFFELYDAVKVCKANNENSVNDMLSKLVSICVGLFLKNSTDLQEECQPLKKYLNKAKLLNKGIPQNAQVPQEDDKTEQPEVKTVETKSTAISYSLDRNTPTFSNSKNENVGYVCWKELVIFVGKSIRDKKHSK